MAHACFSGDEMVSMQQAQVDNVIATARSTCKGTGRGLTKHRQRILEILIKAQSPMSAYELVDAYNESAQTPIVAMSVYRILEFLESVKLVHRLKSANRYIACNSISGVCEHQTSVFLICKSCQKIEEIHSSADNLQFLRGQIEAKGFAAKDSQIEVATLCKACVQKSVSNN